MINIIVILAAFLCVGWVSPADQSGLTASQDVLASSSDAHDVGTSSNYWQEMYSKHMRVRETGTTPTAVSDFGTIWVQTTDGLPHFVDASGTDYSLVETAATTIDSPAISGDTVQVDERLAVSGDGVITVTNATGSATDNAHIFWSSDLGGANAQVWRLGGNDASDKQFLIVDVTGGNYNRLEMHGGGATSETVWNEDGADVDHRIESDTLTNAFSLDGGTGKVTFGGDVQADDFFSGDGTQGHTGTCAAALDLTVKDGLITACA